MCIGFEVIVRILWIRHPLFRGNLHERGRYKRTQKVDLSRDRWRQSLATCQRTRRFETRCRHATSFYDNEQPTGIQQTNQKPSHQDVQSKVELYRVSTMSLVSFQIVPLSMRSGILEWVENSMPIGLYLTGGKDGMEGAHTKYRPNDWPPARCRNDFRVSSKIQTVPLKDRKWNAQQFIFPCYFLLIESQR